jgi:Leucine-rich repeat (LRR) protein
MASMSLIKSIPPEIGLLSSWLVHLDLPEKNFTGSIPAEVYSLTNLKNLYLHNNDMTGMYA